MSKKLIFSLIFSGVIMFFVPLVSVDPSGSELAMASVFTNLFVINPVFTLGIGIFAGTDKDKLWPLPICNSLFFIISYGLIFSFADLMVYMYGICYLLTSTLAMFFIHFIKTKRKD